MSKRQMRNGFIFAIGCLFALNLWPDPPAVQEAEKRRRIQRLQQREEEFTRRIEQRIEAYERENPGWLDSKWDDVNEHEEGRWKPGSQDRS